MTTVTFVDETTSGGRSDSWGLEIAEERLTLGEVIRRRVFQEVAEYNANRPEVFRGLVQPTATERRLNGDKAGDRPRMDAGEQCGRALDAFRRNGFLVLVGDRQIEELEEELDLPLGTEVVFLKLVPLVGG
jgi:hypothetical protein